MLRPDEIQRMQAVEVSSLQGVCRILRAATVRDRSAGTETIYVPESTTVVCDVVPTRDVYRNLGSKENSVNNFIATFPPGTRLDGNDRFRLEAVAQGSVPLSKHLTYEVIEPGVGDPIETAVEVLVSMVVE
jgi:hypothetical protein